MSGRSYEQAMQDFRRARQEAALRQLLQRVSGKSDELLAYNDVSDKLPITDAVERGLQEIPLNAIVGSVGRAEDFTRDFLPRRDSDAERWAAVKAAVIDMKGWPPIQVYQLGDAYFVKDGNHRVSVARRLGNKTITAYVTEIETRLPLGAAADPEAIIRRANYLYFLEKTRLDETRPQADLQLTFTDAYDTLLAQIEQHRRRCAAAGQELDTREAAARWYDEVYRPALKLIREQGVLRSFSDRTEADMYILLSERHQELEEALGWEMKQAAAVSNWATSIAESRTPMLSRLGSRILDSLAPDLEDGPPPGAWRKHRLVTPAGQNLFNEILVSVQGTEADWHLLDNTLTVAQREEGRVMAIHVVPEKKDLDSSQALQVVMEFKRRCAAAGVEGQIALETGGGEGKLLIARSPYVDLLTTNLTFATDKRPNGYLSPAVDRLIRVCPRPILVLTGRGGAPMDRALLAYDGSPKADEALFVATYLAARWQIALSVLTVVTKYTTPRALDRARRYILSNQLVNVNYILGEEPITSTLLKAAREQNSNLLIMGGFGYRPMQHAVLGSTVDDVLAQCVMPTLICR
ncbi:MAG: universal stress protein [Candidatus Promineifilaceae bacterium]